MSQALQRWHTVMATGDVSDLDDLLDDEVVFHSPVVHTPQVGKAITAVYLTAAASVLANPSFQYVREVVGAADAVLEFVVEVDGITVNGVDMIRWNDAGRIVDFKVMLRPLKGVNVVHQKMGELLQKARP